MSSTNSNPLDIVSRPYTPPPSMDSGMAEVTAGAGGVAEMQKKTLEEYVPPPPRGMGKPNQEGALLTTTGNPDLPVPQRYDTQNDAVHDNVTLGQVLVGMLTQKFMVPQPLGTSDTIEMPRKSSTDMEDLSFIRETVLRMSEEEPGLLGPEGLPLLTTSASPPNSTSTPAAVTFDDWSGKLVAAFLSTVPPLPPTTKTIIDSLKSEEVEVLYQTLSDLSGIGTMTGTQEEIQACKDKLRTLSTLIAQANTAGSYQPMQSMNQLAILTWIRTTLATPFNPEHPVLFDTVLNQLAEKVTKANTDVLTKEPDTSSEFYALTGGSTSEIEVELKAMLEASGKLESVLQEFSQEKVTAFLRALSSKIVAKREDKNNKELQSVDKETLSQALQALIQTITPLPLASLIAKVLPTLVDSIAGVNTKQMTAWVYSADKVKVNQSLSELIGLYKPEVAPTTIQIVANYLQVLTAALAMLAQIRCYISQLDGMMANKASEAKMKNAADQVQLSTKVLSLKLEQSSKQFETNAAAIYTSQVLKILMPLIALVVAIVSLVMIIASMGTATVGSAAFVLLIISLVATCATIVIETADAFSAMSTGKSIFEHIFKALNITDETVKAWIQTVITAGLALLCLAGSIATIVITLVKAALQAGAKATLEVVKKALSQVLKEALKTVLTKASTAALLMLSTTIISTPIIPQAIKNSLKAAGVKDETAQIWAMVITMIIAFLPMILSGLSGISGAAKSITKEISKTAEGATEAGLQAAQATAKRASTLAQTAVEALADVGAKKVAFSLKEIPKMIEKIAQKVTGFFKNMFMKGSSSVTKSAGDSIKLVAKPVETGEGTTRFLRLLSQRVLEPLQFILQSSAQIIKVSSTFQQVEMKKEIAEKALAAATIEAFAEEMNQLYALGPEAMLKMISEIEQSSQKQFTSMVQMIDEIIKSASQFTTTLHSKGAA